MADISFTTGPSSSLFWQGGALCRLHCTNTKLFVQREKKGLSFSPLSPFHLFIRLAYMCFLLPNPRVHNAGPDPSVLRQHKQVDSELQYNMIPTNLELLGLSRCGCKMS